MRDSELTTTKTKRLSSGLVPLFKLIFLAVFAWGILLFATDWRNFTEPGPYFLFFWCAAWYVISGRWKSVRLNGDVLKISNYLKTIEVPISEIAQIEGSSFWGWQPQTVKLTLKSLTTFGDEIVFVPRGGGLNAKASAEELRRTLGVVDERRFLS